MLKGLSVGKGVTNNALNTGLSKYCPFIAVNTHSNPWE